MPYTPIDLNRLFKVFDITLFSAIVRNGDWLYGQLGSIPATIQNGDLEVDSDGNGLPDNITIATFAGGLVALDATVSAEGSQCLKFVHPGGAGAGGGSAEFDYVPCSDLKRCTLGFVHWATVAGMHNQVQVRFFDRGKIELAGSAQLIYDSAANPTVPTYIVAGFVPPAGARWYKVGLIGGQTDVNAAGTAYFDAIKADPLPVKTVLNAVVAQAAAATNAWADHGSFAVTAPYTNIPVELSVLAVITADTTVGVRLRIGSAYSTEGFVTGTTSTVRLCLPFMATNQGVQAVTVYMQLIAPLGGSTAGAIADATAALRIDP